jgi:hypothetical protein
MGAGAPQAARRQADGAQVIAPDPWAPWAKADPEALDDVFALDTFDAQVRALLDLAPQASARDVSLLPWDEPHVLNEFKRIREAWAVARAARKDQEEARDEVPIPEAMQRQFEDSVRAKDLRGAKEALDLLARLQANRIVSQAQHKDDDYSRLSDREVLVLGALVHRLRGEPLTQSDENMLAYIALIDTNAEADEVALASAE